MALAEVETDKKVTITRPIAPVSRLDLELIGNNGQRRATPLETSRELPDPPIVVIATELLFEYGDHP